MVGWLTRNQTTENHLPVVWLPINRLKLGPAKPLRARSVAPEKRGGGRSFVARPCQPSIPVRVTSRSYGEVPHRSTKPHCTAHSVGRRCLPSCFAPTGRHLPSRSSLDLLAIAAVLPRSAPSSLISNCGSGFPSRRVCGGARRWSLKSWNLHRW